MKTTHRFTLMIGALGLLLAAPNIADAQGDLEDAARELEDAAKELSDAAQTLDALGADVQGIEAPSGAADGATHACSKFQRIVINFKKQENKVLGDKETPLLVKASGHCNVVIRHVTLRGGLVLDVSGHANVLLADVTIEGKKQGLEISGHANVTVKNSSIAAGKKAMLVSGHANVTLENATLKGSSVVSGFGTVTYDKKSQVSKLKKSGRYSTINRR